MACFRRIVSIVVTLGGLAALGGVAHAEPTEARLEVSFDQWMTPQPARFSA